MGPGALLVPLRRLGTSTDVLLQRDAPGAPLAWAPPRHDVTQGGLVEELIRDTRIDPDALRLYASTLTMSGADGPLGVFVAFVAEAPSDASSAGTWTDLREACDALDPAWAAVLRDVRERFVAQAPDESCRLR